MRFLNRIFEVTVPILNKIRNQDIITSLLTNQEHKYTVVSNVDESVFNSFWNYLKNDINPDVNSSNYYEYRQLCDEFDVIIEGFQNISNPLNLFGMLNDPNTNKTLVEKLIAQNLDNILLSYANNLKNIGITSLSNIFYHHDRILNNHDIAYEFIIDSSTNGNPNFYCLLSSLDATKFTNNDYLRESFMKKEEHLGFCPQNINHFIFNLEQKIADLQQEKDELELQLTIKNEEIIEKNKKNAKFEDINNRLLGLKSKAQGAISQRQFQVVNQFNNKNVDFVTRLNQMDIEVKQTGVGFGEMQQKQFQQLTQIVTELANFPIY